MTLSEKSAVLSATRFRYRVAAAADTCSAALGLLSHSDAGASRRSGNGLRLSDVIGLSFLILHQRDINKAVTNNRKDSENLGKGFQGQRFYTAAAIRL